MKNLILSTQIILFTLMPAWTFATNHLAKPADSSSAVTTEESEDKNPIKISKKNLVKILCLTLVASVSGGLIYKYFATKLSKTKARRNEARRNEARRNEARRNDARRDETLRNEAQKNLALYQPTFGAGLDAPARAFTVVYVNEEFGRVPFYFSSGEAASLGAGHAKQEWISFMGFTKIGGRLGKYFKQKSVPKGQSFSELQKVADFLNQNVAPQNPNRTFRCNLDHDDKSEINQYLKKIMTEVIPADIQATQKTKVGACADINKLKSIDDTRPGSPTAHAADFEE